MCDGVTIKQKIITTYVLKYDVRLQDTLKAQQTAIRGMCCHLSGNGEKAMQSPKSIGFILQSAD